MRPACAPAQSAESRSTEHSSLAARNEALQAELAAVSKARALQEAEAARSAAAAQQQLEALASMQQARAAGAACLTRHMPLVSAVWPALCLLLAARRGSVQGEC